MGLKACATTLGPVLEILRYAWLPLAASYGTTAAFMCNPFFILTAGAKHKTEMLASVVQGAKDGAQTFSWKKKKKLSQGPKFKEREIENGERRPKTLWIPQMFFLPDPFQWLCPHLPCCHFIRLLGKPHSHTIPYPCLPILLSSTAAVWVPTTCSKQGTVLGWQSHNK